MQTLNSASGSYAAAEATIASQLQTAQHDLLGAVNAPTETLLGRPLIGDGAPGTATSPNGGAGGLLYGNGGNGYSATASGVERLTDVAKTRSLMRAASENDRDVRTRIRMRGTTAGGCAHQRQGRRNHDTNDANKAAWSHLHMLTYCRRPRWRWAAET